MSIFTPTHRHIKSGGQYRIIVRGHMEADYPATAVVVYGDAQGRVFVRPATEFDDGRFVSVADYSPDAGKMAADHIVDAAKMVTEPAGDLEKQISAIIFEHVGFSPEDGGTTVTGIGGAARAILALFQPQIEAAEGLLVALKEMDRYDATAEGYDGSPAYHKTQEAIRNAHAAGLGRGNDV